MSFTLIIISDDQIFREKMEASIKLMTDDFLVFNYTDSRIMDQTRVQKAIYLLDRPGKDLFSKVMSKIKSPDDIFSTFYVRDRYEHQNAMFYMKSGAYDFVCSLTALDQLVIRLNNLKNKLNSIMEAEFDNGLHLLTDSCILKFKGKTVKFSKSEHKILCYLFSRSGTTILTSDILFNSANPNVTANNLHVNIFRIREKMRIIKDIKIQRVSKVGYKLIVAA